MSRRASASKGLCLSFLDDAGDDAPPPLLLNEDDATPSGITDAGLKSLSPATRRFFIDLEEETPCGGRKRSFTGVPFSTGLEDELEGFRYERFS